MSYWPPQYGYNYQGVPCFPLTPRIMPPVIPGPVLYPNSPYCNPVSLNHEGSLSTDPTTPNTPNPEINPCSPWEGCRCEGRLSGQGCNCFMPSSNAAGVRPCLQSVGTDPYQPLYCGPGMMSTTYLCAPFWVNAWIDAESPRADFFLDLSLPTFEPMQICGWQSRLFPEEELMQFATSPPITRLMVIFDEFPQWPCYIARDESQPPYPITLHDVLTYIHYHVHISITMPDFVGLGPRDQAGVAEAFTRRCREIPNNFVEERAKGLKRVDYLLGKTRLVGLLRQGHQDGWEIMKVVSQRIGT